MKETRFSIDTVGEREFFGYTDGRTWNGWACPYFPFDQAQRLVATWQEHGWKAEYDAKQDAFRFALADDGLEAAKDVETFEAVVIDGEKFYPIGNGSWIWDELEPATA